jgi:hypothetical protein
MLPIILDNAHFFTAITRKSPHKLKRGNLVDNKKPDLPIPIIFLIIKLCSSKRFFNSVGVSGW